MNSGIGKDSNRCRQILITSRIVSDCCPKRLGVSEPLSIQDEDTAPLHVGCKEFGVWF